MDNNNINVRLVNQEKVLNISEDQINIMKDVMNQNPIHPIGELPRS
jgi:hypothetical protein